MTSVLGDGRYTVSGHPHDLILFVRTLPNGVASHVTAINALYHCSSFLRGVRDEVLRDVISRHVRFPGFLDILAPIRSTLSGSLISNTTSSGSLVELVIDMVLMHPVNWDFVLHQTVSTLPPHITVNLIDLGLGSSLVRGFEASVCRNGAVRKFEVVYPQQDSVPKYKTKQEPIAIIGMAVNMPGAPTASKLWDVIANGLNTVEKVRIHLFPLIDKGYIEAIPFLVHRFPKIGSPLRTVLQAVHYGRKPEISSTMLINLTTGILRLLRPLYFI